MENKLRKIEGFVRNLCARLKNNPLKTIGLLLFIGLSFFASSLISGFANEFSRWMFTPMRNTGAIPTMTITPVGWGGAGGASDDGCAGGGGGGGGVIKDLTIPVSAGTYEIKVGKGGTTSGSNGEASSITGNGIVINAQGGQGGQSGDCNR
jgi:hypothetical protein